MYIFMDFLYKFCKPLDHIQYNHYIPMKHLNDDMYAQDIFQHTVNK